MFGRRRRRPLWVVTAALLTVNLSAACGSDDKATATTTTAAEAVDACDSAKDEPVDIAEVLKAAPRWWEVVGSLEVEPYRADAKLTVAQDARFQQDPVLIRAEGARAFLDGELQSVTAIVGRALGERGASLARSSRLIIAPRARGTWLIEVDLGERLKVLGACGRAPITPLAKAAELSDGLYTELDIARGLQEHDAEIEALYYRAAKQPA